MKQVDTSLYAVMYNVNRVYTYLYTVLFLCQLEKFEACLGLSQICHNSDPLFEK